MPPANATSGPRRAARPRRPTSLLVVRAGAAHPLVEQHLPARLADVVAEVAVLLLAVRQLLVVAAPDQPLDDHAALGRVAEQRRRPSGPPGRSRSSASPRQSVKKRWSPSSSADTSSTSRAKYADPCTWARRRCRTDQSAQRVAPGCRAPRRSGTSPRSARSPPPVRPHPSDLPAGSRRMVNSRRCAASPCEDVRDGRAGQEQRRRHGTARRTGRHAVARLRVRPEHVAAGGARAGASTSGSSCSTTWARAARTCRRGASSGTGRCDGYADDVLELCRSWTCAGWCSWGTRSAR